MYSVLIDDIIQSELEPIVPAPIIKPTSTSPSRQSLSGGSHINKAAVTSDHETANIELKRSIASNTPPVQKHSLADYSPLASSSISSFSSYDSYLFSPPTTQTSPDGRVPPIVNLTDIVGDDNDNDYLDDVFHKEVYDNLKQKLKETL